MKRVIITGATGFVGANLARRLLHEGHDVHLLLRPGHDPWRLAEIRQHVRLHEVELTDEASLAALVGQIRPDWVFHLAAYGAYPSQNDLRRMIATNIAGTCSLVQSCLKHGFEAFVNTGSSSEYGFKDHAPAEAELVEPNSHYAVTKASATLFCRHTAQKHGVRLPTLRLYSVFGPFEEPTRLIPTLILHGMEGKFPPLVNPKIARDYVHVDDVSEAYLLAATGPLEEMGAVYNVGTGVQTTLREVVEVAREVLQVPGAPAWGSMPDRAWDTSTWVADNRKIKRELGWEAHLSFGEGFRQTVEYFRRNPSICEFYRAQSSAHVSGRKD